MTNRAIELYSIFSVWYHRSGSHKLIRPQMTRRQTAKLDGRPGPCASRISNGDWKLLDAEDGMDKLPRDAVDEELL